MVRLAATYSFVMAPTSVKDSSALPQALLHELTKAEIVLLDQEQIEAPQFSESHRQASRLESVEPPVPPASAIMTPFSFGVALMRTAFGRQEKWTIPGSAAQRGKAKG
jgi:hypothetical protein